MPNYCYSKLTIQGEPKQLNKMLKQVEITESEATADKEATKFSFEKIIPMPASEKSNWYEWRIENWGTKWDMAIDYDTLDNWENGEVYVDFRTAWSPPIPILLKLSEQNPKLKFFWNCWEESYEYWCEGNLKKGEWAEYYEGNFKSCAEYQKFDLTHHECQVCGQFVDECDNSDTQEIEACAECKTQNTKLEQELENLDKELWG